MRLVTFCTLVLVAVSGVVAACGSSSSGSPADAQDGGVGSDSGGVPSEGGADASVKSDIPGDPATAVAAAVEVTINGQKRVFEGPATWTKFPSDGGTIVGFQTNAHSASDWTLVLAVFGNTPGTYSCSGSPRGGGLSLTNRILGDGGILADWTEYGGTVTSERCSITLVSYGSQQGDHVTGTFTGELDLSQGDAPITHLTLTAGKFDLVQSASVPP